MDDVTAAKAAIALLDLTSLNDNDSAPRIEKLCKKAVTSFGNVRAVCIYQKFIPVAKELLRDTNIKIATVVNFPKGDSTIKTVRDEIKKAISSGAEEIDAVLPYKKLIAGNIDAVREFLEMVVEECGKKTTTKIIIESGELKKSGLISQACDLCIEAGVNFIKTSTGKTEISATPETANLILEKIKESGKDIGLKVSGGIKTSYDAKKYLILANTVMGEKWISPKHLRFGASSLLDDLIKTIEQGY
ncbi:MAG: deoxyribose-phosphate aldolase [Lactobacillaceae bacterium]|jgi:deoxyribose-phosphate aldolase|nr:deoxyribose-phosphate aldolase [Lactobacillaceae bacterium]